MTDRLTVREFLEFRKSLYRQSFRFVAQQPAEVLTVFALDNVTDPSSRVTEERVQDVEGDRIEEQECKMESDVAKVTSERFRSPDADLVAGNEKLKTLPKQRWTSVMRAAVVGTAGHMSVGSVDILPLMASSGGGMVCFFMAAIVSLLVMAPVMLYELLLGQIYQGTAPRAYVMRHPRLSGMAVILLITGLIGIPESIHHLGSGVVYLKHCFQTPIAWALSDQDYRMCGQIMDPDECRKQFKCTMFESLCVANPFKYAEHHFNRTVLNIPDTEWPPNPTRDWPLGWSFNWRVALGGGLTFLVFWTAVELGGRKIMEFLAIGGVGIDLFVLAMVIPFAINLEGALPGLRTSFFDRNQWSALFTPREYLTVFGVMLNGCALLSNINLYIGSGFRIDHSDTRVLPTLTYGLLLLHSLLMALVESSLAGSMDPQYRAKVKSTLVHQTGKDFLSLDNQSLPTTSTLQADLAPSTARHWGTIICPVMLASMYGATEWALLFFVAIVLRRGVRSVLLVRSLRAWVHDARKAQDKFRTGQLRSSWERQLRSSALTAGGALLVTWLLLFRHHTADGQTLASRLTAALSEGAVPLALTLLAFTDFWLLPPNGFAYDSLSATLVVLCAFVTFIVASICAILAGPRALGKPWLNYLSLALVAFVFLAPATVLIIHYGRTFAEWWPFTQAIACSGRTEEFRKKANIIMGVYPPWKRLRKVTFSFALKCVVPFMAFGAFMVPLAQWEKRRVTESWPWNPDYLYYLMAPAGPPFDLPLSVIYFFNASVVIGTTFFVGCCCPTAIRWMWPTRASWWTMRDLAKRKDPGPRHVLRRARVSIREEVFSSTPAIWRQAFTVKPRRRY